MELCLAEHAADLRLPLSNPVLLIGRQISCRNQFLSQVLTLNRVDNRVISLVAVAILFLLEQSGRLDHVETISLLGISGHFPHLPPFELFRKIIIRVS